MSARQPPPPPATKTAPHSENREARGGFFFFLGLLLGGLLAWGLPRPHEETRRGQQRPRPSILSLRLVECARSTFDLHLNLHKVGELSETAAHCGDLWFTVNSIRVTVTSIQYRALRQQQHESSRWSRASLCFLIRLRLFAPLPSFLRLPNSLSRSLDTKERRLRIVEGKGRETVARGAGLSCRLFPPCVPEGGVRARQASKRYDWTKFGRRSSETEPQARGTTEGL